MKFKYNFELLVGCLFCFVVRKFEVFVAQWSYLVHQKGDGEYQKYVLILETWNHVVDIKYNVVFDELTKNAIIKLHVSTGVSRSQLNWNVESFILKKMWLWNED